MSTIPEHNQANDLAEAVAGLIAGLMEAYEAGTLMEALAAIDVDVLRPVTHGLVMAYHTSLTGQQTIELREVLADLVDGEACWFDHHGYCQAHGWLTDGECPQARAKRLVTP